MKVYVQGENELIPLQEDVAAEDVENALGYTPANEEDLPDITNVGDDALCVTDSQGNVITRTDSEGFHAKAMTVNGKDVESGLVTDADRESWGGSDLDDVISKDDDSALYVTDSQGNILFKVDKDSTSAVDVKVGEEQKSVAEHLNDSSKHIGDEIELTDDKAFYITDSKGNIILRVDEYGVHAAEVYVGNETVSGMVSDINKKIETTESIAKGANQAVSYGNYSTMITALNSLAKDAYNVGQNIMIVALEVPDLWVSSISATKTTYTYVDDNTFITVLKEKGSVQVGYYVLAALETQKVDLTDYAKTGDIPEALSELTEDATHRTVTDTEKATWNKVTEKLDSSTFTEHKTEYESHKTDYASHKSAFETHKTEFESHKGDNTHLGDEIKLDDDTALYIVDSVGNKIAQFDGSGLDVAALKLAGIDISDKIDTDIVTALNEAIENGDLGGSGLTAEQIALLKKLSDWYDDEHYENISITSFTNTLSGSHEKGDTVTGSATLAWAFNRTPKALTLNGTSKSVSSTGETIASATYSSDKTWTLKATGENGETSSRSTGIYFYNAIFYGVSSSTTYDTTLLTSLTKSLQNSHKSSLSVTAGEGEYIYYCVPASFSTPTFTIGGFVGGLTKVATVSYTNGTNTEDYYIYRSDYANLGDTTISIS